MVPQWGPCEQRFPVSRANVLFIHSYLSESPFKELSHQTGGKHTVTFHRPRRGRKGYTGVRPGSARRSYTRMLLLPECHEVFSTITTLAWIDENPFSQRVSQQPSTECPLYICYLLPRDRGYESPNNPEVRTDKRVGFMGSNRKISKSLLKEAYAPCTRVLLTVSRRMLDTYLFLINKNFKSCKVV